MASPTADPESVMRRIVDEIWNGGDLALVDEVVADEYRLRNPSLDLEAEGPDGYKNVVRTFRSSFPDFELSVEDQVASGDLVAIRYAVRGTHQGDFLGIPPTGTKIEVDAVSIVHLEEGRAVDEWAIYDVLGLMQQVGIAPAPQYFEQ